LAGADLSVQVCGSFSRTIIAPVNAKPNLLVPATLLYAEFLTMTEQTMTDQEFRNRSDSSLETLRKRLQILGDEYNFEVEGDGGRLDLCFEEPEETRFVISPNAPVRQIWISALTTSFKLAWSDAAKTFVLEKSGETMAQVMSRILSQQLGQQVTV
jgi:iron donor protein CyaY